MESSHEKGAYFAPEGAPIERIRHPKVGLFWLTYLTLQFLLVVTVLLYYIDLSKLSGWVGMNLVVALIVATVKAVLVVLNFMNVKGGTRLIWLWAALGFIWLLLMGGIFLDYLFRPTFPGWTPNTH